MPETSENGYAHVFCYSYTGVRFDSMRIHRGSGCRRGAGRKGTSVVAQPDHPHRPSVHDTQDRSVRAARVAVTDLIDTEGAEHADDAVAGHALDLTALLSDTESALILSVMAFDTRNLGRVYGSGSAKAWLTAWTGVAPVIAARWLRSGRLLASCPEILDRFKAGRFGPAHLDALARARGQGRKSVFDEQLDLLLELTDTLPYPADYDRAIAHWRHAADDLVGQRNPQHRYESRHLRFATTIFGMLSINGLVDETGAGVVREALDDLTGPPDPANTAGGPRDAGQRSADAMVELCRFYLAHRNERAGAPVATADLVITADLVASFLAAHPDLSKAFANGETDDDLNDDLDDLDNWADDTDRTSDDHGTVGADETDRIAETDHIAETEAGTVAASDTGNRETSGEGDHDTAPEQTATNTSPGNISPTNTSPTNTGPRKNGAPKNGARHRPLRSVGLWPPDSDDSRRSEDGRCLPSEENDNGSRCSTGTGTPGPPFSPFGDNPGGYDPGRYNPGGYNPGGYNPGGYVPVGRLAGQAIAQALVGAEVEGHGAVSAATAEQLLCDCLLGIVILDPTNEPVNLGRQRRTFTRRQRRLLRRRDGGCVWPGCSRPLDWCQLHHLLPWLHGGHTDIDNLTSRETIPTRARLHGERREGPPGSSGRPWTRRSVIAEGLGRALGSSQ